MGRLGTTALIHPRSALVLSKQPVTRSILTFHMRKGLVRDMGKKVFLLLPATQGTCQLHGSFSHLATFVDLGSRSTLSLNGTPVSHTLDKHPEQLVYCSSA